MNPQELRFDPPPTHPLSESWSSDEKQVAVHHKLHKDVEAKIAAEGISGAVFSAPDDIFTL